jgi:hypothetical protein
MVKTCFRAPRVIGSGAFGVTLWFPRPAHFAVLLVLAPTCGSLDRDEDKHCLISVLCVMTVSVWTRHVVRGQSEQNYGSFYETKTPRSLFLSWITRKKLPRCIPRKNEKNIYKYSSVGLNVH